MVAARLNNIRNEKKAIRLQMRALLQQLEDLEEEEEGLLHGVTVAEDLDGPLAPGQRVVVARNDQYYRRTGVITRKAGSSSWDVRLDRAPDEPMARTIMKAGRSLLRLHQPTKPRPNSTSS